MIKIYLLVATIFLEILFIWFELDELQNWYKAIEDQMFEDFSTREKQRKYARKKSSKKYIQNIDCRFVSIIWNFFFEIVQSQKVVLVEIIQTNEVFTAKKISREKSIELENY